MRAYALQPGGLRAFVAALVDNGRRRLAWVIAIQTAAALGQAIGVLLLIPLLSEIGIGASRGVAHFTRHLFLAVGVKPTLAIVLAAYIVVTAVTAALGAYQTVLSTRYRLEFINRIRARLYAAIGAAEWRRLIGIQRPDLLAVLTANVVLVGGGVLGALGVVVAAIVVLGQLVVVVQISALMTALAVASGLALVLVVWPLVRRSRRLGAEMVRLNKQSVRRAAQFLDALKLAKAYGREREHQTAYLSSIDEARDAQVSFAWANGIATAGQSTLTACLLALTVYIAVKLEHVPVGSLLVFAVAFMRVVSQIVGAQSNIQQVALALPAYDEVSALIADLEAAGEPTAARVAPVGIGSGVVLEDVRFSYPSDHHGGSEALRGVSLVVPRGSTIALAGPSGAGKTTIADLVAGLLAPTAGQVLVGGRPLTPERMHSWRRSVALVPQEPFLFNDTVEANLRWARPDASEADLWEALAMANAAEFVGDLDAGLETVVGDRGMRISGGERQRLALARALLRQPELLILDEATSSLDSENELAIRRALASLKGRATVLLIAHRLSTISEADELVVLDHGKVVERGTWAELEHGRGRLQALITAGTTP
jgi:ATP-binding cassette subfamily C protein